MTDTAPIALPVAPKQHSDEFVDPAPPRWALRLGSSEAAITRTERVIHRRLNEHNDAIARHNARVQAALDRIVGANLPRATLVVAAQPAVVHRTREALMETSADWRTPASLAKELGVSESEVRAALASMGVEVRQPVAASGNELNYYRLTERGRTWRERVRMFLLAVGRTPANKAR